MLHLADTHRTHDANDSLPQEAGVDVIRSLSSTLETQNKMTSASKGFLFQLDGMLPSGTLRLLNKELNCSLSVYLLVKET